MRNLAHRFHNPNQDLDQQIRQAVHPDYDPGNGTYFWVADDRGLADYVIGGVLALRSGDVEPRELPVRRARFGTGALHDRVLAHTGGARASSGRGVRLARLAQVMLIAFRFPTDRDTGAKRSPYTNRGCSICSLVSVLHLAVLAAARPTVNRLAWVTADPASRDPGLPLSRAIVDWLGVSGALRARGFTVWGVGCAATARRPSLHREVRSPRPVFVAILLACSLVGLKQYQRRRIIAITPRPTVNELSGTTRSWGWPIIRA